MKPFIFAFKELPQATGFDYSTVEYDSTLNLTVDKATGRPAVESLNLETETITRTFSESSSDPDSEGGLKFLLGTETSTLDKKNETTGSDKGHAMVLSMLETETRTLMVEDTDSDKDWPLQAVLNGNNPGFIQ